MSRALAVILRGVLFGLIAMTVMVEAQPPAPRYDPSQLQALEWREVGPYRGGRAAAVAGIPQQRDVYYFGACGGGVWKTLDGGRSWKNVSDGFFGGSIGAVAVSEWDPNVIYVGGGEKTLRGNVSHGKGMWKSTDAGRTWKKVGLEDSRHICRIRIHPRDPNLVYAAVLGHLFGPNEQRGVFRSLDGGATWKRVHFVNENAGAVDLVMDPTNARILYASFWRVKRTPYSLESGGEGSGLWKSTDGGDTWKELSEMPGLPASPLGISGIAVSQRNPDNLYAIIEAEKGGVFRSRDAGKTWKMVNSKRKLRQRAWYYTRIYADPGDEESVYVLNVRFHRSKDGGKTFSPISVPHGDNHDLWIDPNDPLRMIQSNDGGANISYDGARTWSPQDNQPTAQMYRVSLDTSFPYRLLGGQQDNSALRIRSRSALGGAIGFRDWEPTAGGESGHIVAHPTDPDIVYGGSYGGYLTMVNHRTGERRAVNVWPDNPMGWGARDLKYRFQWNFPLFFSPHDPDLLYTAGNVLFATRDGGASWKKLSGDLTRNDKTRMGSSGGPITKDNTSVEYYGTIFAAAESHLERGVLWTGSDDGLIHVSRDGGGSWANATPKDMPDWAMINSIETHPFEKGGLYVAATRYKLDDFQPYLYRTLDYGKTWTKITAGIPEDHFTRVVRADPGQRGLLYAGTESGVHVSFDDGAQWQSLQLKLPIVPVTDLAVRDGDLVVATQGRGFWILDDVSPLRQLTSELAGSNHLFEPRPCFRLASRRRSKPVGMGMNPPDGAVIYYTLAEAAALGSDLKMEILDADQTLIRTFTRKPQPEDGPKKEEDEKSDQDKAEDLALLPAKKGLNRFAWNLQHAGAEKFPDMVIWSGRLGGPRAIPGDYEARLTVGKWSESVRFTVRPDPRSSAKKDDYQAQFDFMVRVRQKLTETHREITSISSVEKQLAGLTKSLAKEAHTEEVRTAAKSLKESLLEIKKALYQTKNKSRQDPLNFPIRLNDKLAGLLSLGSRGDFGPTKQALQMELILSEAIDTELQKLRKIWAEDLPAFNRLARDAEVPAVILKHEPKPDH